jgi:uncharacterized membrane protein (UPF0182 family)
MSDPVYWPQPHRPTPSRSGPQRHSRWFLFVLIAIAIVLFGGRTWLSYYVDSLWFGSLGYASVFWKTLGIESAVFCSFTAATFIILYGSFLVLKPKPSDDYSDGHTIYIGQQQIKLPVERILKVVGIIAALFVAFVTGAIMTAQWSTFALYWNAPVSGITDPIFAKSLSFYLFTLPVWNLIAGWLTVMAVITTAAAGFFLLASGGARALQMPRGLRTPLPWKGLSLTFAFLLLMIAAQVYLGRYDRLFADHTVFDGVTYTDAHVILPGLIAISLALVIGAIIAVTNAFGTGGSRRLVIAVLPAIACYFVLQIAGWYVSSFIVKPNELVREQPYIRNNINMTRQAYDLNRVTMHEFPAETSVAAADPAQNQGTLQNIRLWDWRALQDTLRQIQEIRTYYDFPDIDIDRYKINGQLREVMLAPRELNVNKLPEGSRNWINEKLIYTHGYGITMNSVNGFTPEGLPKLMLRDMPVQSSVPGLEVKQPEIYFGELTNTDVYVKTHQKEFNYPQGQMNSFTNYAGTGGIVIGNMLRRILLAADRDDLGKLPFSDDVNSESRLLMRRNIMTRVNTLAPFLTYEPDPYIVIGDDGRLYWMIDAYTTSDSYPYSSNYQLGDNTINYMRNSVKVVIDAYNGTTTFYVFDPADPIINAYRNLFPALFKDASAMPADLRAHVRYPELLLEMQAQVYALYHMTDPEVFYNREDLWNVASEVTGNGGQQTQILQPNYVLMRLPGEPSEEFVEILPFTPANRNNLIAWIAGRSDGANYGTAIAYNFPKSRLVDGPMQVEARIDQNAQLSGQLTLWNQQGSHVRRGTLLVIPIGKALLYAEPIYLQAQNSPMPELRMVVLALQDNLAYAPTYEQALAQLFGNNANVTEVAQTEQSPQTGSASAQPPPKSSIDPRIAAAAKDLEDYQRLTSEGKLGEAGQKLEHLKQTLQELTGQK